MKLTISPVTPNAKSWLSLPEETPDIIDNFEETLMTFKSVLYWIKNPDFKGGVEAVVINASKRIETIMLLPGIEANPSFDITVDVPNDQVSQYIKMIEEGGGHKVSPCLGQ